MTQNVTPPQSSPDAAAAPVAATAATPTPAAETAEDIVLAPDAPVQDTAVQEPAVQETPVQTAPAPVQEPVKDQPAATDKEPEEKKVKSEIPTHRSKAILSVAYSMPAVSWSAGNDTYALPNDFADTLSAKLSNSIKIELGDNAQDQEWGKILAEGQANSTLNDMLSGALEREDSEYRQGVVVKGQTLNSSVPRFRAVENGETIKGDSGVLRVMTHLGMGSLFQVPLWHSGFWITFKPPTESELLELQRVLNADKVEFGRYSYGRIYSGVVAYTVNRLVDFALDHVYDYTVKNSEIAVNQLKDYIAIQDIFPLLWGFMTTVYPKGFQYERACTSDPEKCHHVVKEVLNLSKLLWVDNAALNEWQKNHMASRQSQNKDKASVLRYREEFINQKPARYEIWNNSQEERKLFVTFKTGNVSDYIDASYLWISDIVNAVEAAAAKDSTAEEKNAQIENFGRASILRQSTHQVASIETESFNIDDPQTIRATLSALSSETAVTNAFIEKLDEFNNNATIAVVGIPAYNCPQCGGEQQGMDQTSFVNIIPLDVIQLFFDFITLRSERILRR